MTEKTQKRGCLKSVVIGTGELANWGCMVGGLGLMTFCIYFTICHFREVHVESNRVEECEEEHDEDSCWRLGKEYAWRALKYIELACDNGMMKACLDAIKMHAAQLGGAEEPDRLRELRETACSSGEEAECSRLTIKSLGAHLHLQVGRKLDHRRDRPSVDVRSAPVLAPDHAPRNRRTTHRGKEGQLCVRDRKSPRLEAGCSESSAVLDRKY